MSMEWVAKLRPAMENLCAAWGVPLGVCIGWVQAESAGRIEEVTNLDERGLFQLLPEESQDLGLDHQRLSTDVSYSLAAGFKLMGYYRAFARRIFNTSNMGQIPEGTEYAWRIAKLGHSLGQGATRILFLDAALAGSAGSWDELKAFAIAKDDYYLEHLKHRPSKWIALVDRVFEIGRPYGVDVLACEGPTPKPVG